MTEMVVVVVVVVVVGISDWIVAVRLLWALE
jgi:hypothetical protein